MTIAVVGIRRGNAGAFRFMQKLAGDAGDFPPMFDHGRMCDADLASRLADAAALEQKKQDLLLFFREPWNDQIDEISSDYFPFNFDLSRPRVRASTAGEIVSNIRSALLVPHAVARPFD